jgi:hypothetical protein
METRGCREARIAAILHALCAFLEFCGEGMRVPTLSYREIREGLGNTKPLFTRTHPPAPPRPYRGEREIGGNSETVCTILHSCTGTLSASMPFTGTFTPRSRGCGPQQRILSCCARSSASARTTGRGCIRAKYGWYSCDNRYLSQSPSAMTDFCYVLLSYFRIKPCYTRGSIYPLGVIIRWALAGAAASPPSAGLYEGIGLSATSRARGGDNNEFVTLFRADLVGGVTLYAHGVRLRESRLARHAMRAATRLIG